MRRGLLPLRRLLASVAFRLRELSVVLRCAGVLLLAFGAEAKDWRGVQPGTTTRAEVLQKLGKPDKKVAASQNLETLVYTRGLAAFGLRQAQVTIDSATDVVRQVALNPAGVVDRFSMEKTY